MFCPQCKSEYQEGITRCSDCNIDLVTSLAPEDHELNMDYIELTSTLNIGNLMFIKSVFDAEGIDYKVFGENFTYVDPLIVPARIVVRQDQYELATELIKTMEFKNFGLSPRSSEEDDEEETE
jgi:hypothetical protein